MEPQHPQPAKHHLPVVASLLGVGSGLVWSFGAILSRKADGVDAFQYMVWRSVGIIVVMEVLHVVTTRRRLTGERYVPRTVVAWTSDRTMAWANVGLFLASLAFVYAVKTTTAANAAFLSSLTPLVAVVFARFLGERLTRSTIVAIAVGCVGLTVTVLGDLEAGNMLGNTSALLASVGFALYTVCLRTDQARDWSPVLSGYALMMIVVCSSISLLKGHTLLPGATDIVLALVHGAIVIVVGTLMFNAAAKQVPAVPMTVFAQTEMVFVPVWAFVVLHDRPAALTVLGGCIIFSAVIGKALYDAAGGRRTDYTVAPDVPLM
ncbi:MAG: DMT family transporter [Actinomycetota bacterium]|nr:DMT family transporter [Actinomycetota bacterium]